MFAYGHAGLEILYYCTYRLLYSKVHKNTTTCEECMHVTAYSRDMS